MTFDPIVTLYPDGTDSLPESDLPFSGIIARIKSGQYRAKIKAIRQRFHKTLERGADREAAKKQVNWQKKKLHSFSASGRFSIRGEIYLQAHSGLIQADFDLLGDRLSEIRAKLAADPYVVALFTSPTGEGLKAFYRVSPAPDKPEHLRRYFAVEKHCLDTYGVQIDESVKDMSRLCFVSDDPEALLKDAIEIEPIDPPLITPKSPGGPVKTAHSKPSAPAFQQASPDDATRVREALRFVSAADRPWWLKIASALKHHFGEAGWSLFDEWSRTAPDKYDEAENRKAWDSLTDQKCTIATVFHKANEGGYVRPGKPVSANGQHAASTSEYLPPPDDVPQESGDPPWPGDAKPKPTVQDESARIQTILDDRIFNFHVIPPPVVPVYWLGQTPICTPGNLTAISAAVKSGKSSALGAMIASTMSSEGDCLGFRSSNPHNHALIHLDTEQSKEDHDALIRRAIRRSGLSKPPDWLFSFCLTGLPVKDLQALLEHLLKNMASLCGGIHSVLIDGVADMIGDVNDAETSNAIVSAFHGQTIAYHCPLIGVIHLNPDGEKTRGHLGSQLERKSETNLRLEREGDGETIVMWSDKNRRAPIIKRTAPRFAWDQETGMHVSVDYRPAPKTAGGRTSVVDQIASMNSHEFLAACSPDGETRNGISRRLESWLATQKLDASEETCRRAVAALCANGKLAKGKDLLFRKGSNA